MAKDKTQSGRLRHRITIMAPPGQADQNTLGEVKPDWSVFAKRWAEVQMGQGKEFLAAQRVNADLTHVVTLRWLEGVTAGMKVCWGTSVMEIVAPPSIDELGWWMEIHCIETVGRGL